ncbi:ankyrin repeat-containing domain protein [Lactarius pseudohatsudake]|nr:ankyrin repeat-containing domain protein [Lactarius pseudohatsudake]
MTSSIQASSSSTPNFQPIFEKAIEEDKKKTGNDLTAHPLAAQAEINGCDSLESILTRSSTRSLLLGSGAGSVFPPAKIIFSGISILLVVCLLALFSASIELHRFISGRRQRKRTVANRDVALSLLTGRGADVNARDQDDETPLHLASYFPELELVQMLLDLGANVNAADNRGRSPLHRVLDTKTYSDNVGFGVAQATKLLVERGADVNALEEDHDLNAENNKGKIPFQLVQESMRKEMERPPLKYFFPQAEIPERRARAQGVALTGLLYGY